MKIEAATFKNGFCNGGEHLKALEYMNLVRHTEVVLKLT